MQDRERDLKVVIGKTGERKRPGVQKNKNQLGNRIENFHSNFQVIIIQEKGQVKSQ